MYVHLRRYVVMGNLARLYPFVLVRARQGRPELSLFTYSRDKLIVLSVLYLGRPYVVIILVECPRTIPPQPWNKPLTLQRPTEKNGITYIISEQASESQDSEITVDTMYIPRVCELHIPLRLTVCM